MAISLMLGASHEHVFPSELMIERPVKKRNRFEGWEAEGTTVKELREYRYKRKYSGSAQVYKLGSIKQGTF